MENYRREPARARARRSCVIIRISFIMRNRLIDRLFILLTGISQTQPDKVNCFTFNKCVLKTISRQLLFLRLLWTLCREEHLVHFS